MIKCQGCQGWQCYSLSNTHIDFPVVYLGYVNLDTPATPDTFSNIYLFNNIWGEIKWKFVEYVVNIWVEIKNVFVMEK